MTNRTHFVMATCAVLAAASILHSTVRAQGGKAAADGIYTDAQAKRGQTLYVDKCAPCHGDDLTGQAGIIPALTGDSFAMNWQDKSVGDLFDKISMTMPALEPGSLKPEQAADLIAHILSVSKFPAGAAELAPQLEALQQIRIGAPTK